MPLSFVGPTPLDMLDFSLESGVIVPAEGEREKVLARGPKCVSFSSNRGLLVNDCEHIRPKPSQFREVADNA